MWTILILLLLLILLIIVIVWLFKKKKTEGFKLKLSESSISLPIIITCSRQITIPSKVTDDYTIKMNYPVDIQNSQLSLLLVQMNELTINRFSDYPNGLDNSLSDDNGINLLNITPSSFDINMGFYTMLGLQNNPNSALWPRGGISMINLYLNSNSQYKIEDLPYIINYGSCSFKEIWSTFINDPSPNFKVKIPFKIKHNFIPTLIIPQNHRMINFVEKTQEYFCIELTQFCRYFMMGKSSSLPKIFDRFDWLSISDNPTSTIEIPYVIDHGTFNLSNNLQSQMYKLSTMNESEIANTVRFNKKFDTPPVVINSDLWTSIDQITTEYFHYTEQSLQYIQLDTKLNSFDWIAIEMKSVKPILNYMTPQDIISSEPCPSKEFVHSDCPTFLTDIDSCPKYIVNYLQTPRIEYVDWITIVIKKDSKKSYDNADDKCPCIELKNIASVNLSMQGPKNCTSSNDQIVAVTHIDFKNNNTSHINVNVNTDYGIYSSCDSIGNLFIRINSNTPSTIELNFIFNRIGISKNNCYYVQWGTSDDEIYGPFKDENPTLKFGKPLKCAPFNVKCKVKSEMKKICSSFLDGSFNALEDQAIKKGEKQFGEDNWWLNKPDVCTPLANGIKTACVTVGGGPANILADVLCSGISNVVKSECNSMIVRETKWLSNNICSKLDL